jgi:hypothetical protein
LKQIRASSTKFPLFTTALTKNCGSPRDKRKSRKPNSNKKFLKSDAKQNNQPRELKKTLPPAPLKKTAKAQQETPKAQFRHKNLTARGQQTKKACPCHYRAHKNCESPTGRLESPTPTKNCASPTRSKNINAMSSTISPLPSLKQKKAKAKQKQIPASLL